jgi:hypothetical protein
MNDRMITTGMSAKIVSGLLKKGWSVRRIARTIGVSVEFVEGVQKKVHVLTLRDIESLADRSGQTVNRMIFDSLTPVRAESRPLFDSVRQVLDACETSNVAVPRKSRKKRRVGQKAA